jgi:hypothetical protein
VLPPRLSFDGARWLGADLRQLALDDSLELSPAKEALQPRPEDGYPPAEECEKQRDRDVRPNRRGIQRDDHTTTSMDPGVITSTVI